MARHPRQTPAQTDAEVGLLSTMTFMTASLVNSTFTPTAGGQFHYIQFNAITTGSGGAIDGGGNLNLTVPLTQPPTITLTMQCPNATGAFNFLLSTAFNFGSIQTPYVSVPATGTAPVTVTNVALPYSSSLLTFTPEIATDTVQGPINWSVGSVALSTSTTGPPPPTQPTGADTFSESPATLIDVDALIASGSHTPSGPTDKTPLTFSAIQFGAANIDSNGNLQFNDVVQDDIPLLVLTLTVTPPPALPATITVWGEWDYSGTQFVITTVNITTTAATTITNIPIFPPNYPQFGQGDILQLWLSSSTIAPIAWSSGHVYGTETVPVYPSVENAPIPPSIVGRSYILTGGTVNANFPAYTPLFPPPLVGQGGGAAPTFPPPTPPPIGAIPVGVLVGPAIAAAAVPPSIAGKALIIFTFGSATTPPASAAFPQGTTTYPSPPIVFSNIYTGGSTPVTPPSTASTPPMGISYNTGGQWGPPIGPALPPVVPVSRPFMVATNGDPSDVVYAVPTSEPNGNGEVYDDSDEENEDWVEETPHRPTEPPKPRGRGRRRR